MVQFTVIERRRILELFNSQGTVEAARLAMQEFGRQVTHLQVRRLVIKFNTRFCLHNQNARLPGHGTYSGRPKTARTAENILRIQHLVENKKS